jgi:amino acid permease
MSSYNRLRSSFLQRKTTIDTDEGRNEPENLSILNPGFSVYQRFDTLMNNQTQENIHLKRLANNELSLTIDSFNDINDGSSTNSKRTLRTLRGVFCPVLLSMLSISIFIRLGFVVAHAGVLHTLLQFALCFIILFMTLLSVCALATNGAIQGGGVYHMISRALGPEFGGSIGVLFFVANVIGNGQSVAALVETLVELFGSGSTNRFSVVDD